MSVKTTTTLAAADVSLESALLIYRSKGISQSRSWVTKHPIKRTTSGPVIMEGKPLTERDAKALVGAIEGEQSKMPMTWLESSQLAIANNRMLFWVPPQERTLFYDSEGLPERLNVECPGLVFLIERQSVGHGGQINVYAVAGKGRPRPTDSLYLSPFFNCNDQGGVCLGSAIRPQQESFFDVTGWVGTFFLSRFTHPNGGGKVKKVTLYKYWADIAKKAEANPGEAVPINIKDLVKTKLKVSDLLR